MIDWAHFETGVRKIIAEVVEPIKDDTNHHVKMVKIANYDIEGLKRRI